MLNFYLISRFPQQYWGRIGRGLNLLYDVLAGIIVYVVASDLAHRNGIDDTIAGLTLAQVALLLFMTSPILMPITGRLRGIKGRSFGLPVFLIFAVILKEYYLEGTFLHLALIPIVTIVMLHVSMFGMQALVFAAITTAIWYIDPIPLVIVGAVCIGGYYLPVGLRDTLTHHLHFKIWYWNSQKKGTSASGRNDLKRVLRLPLDLFFQPYQFLTTCLHNNSFIISIVSVPAILLIPYIIYS
ncbi:MAG: hypothetical protein AAFY56_17820, partial [Pseudomonadota bacterium]